MVYQGHVQDGVVVLDSPSVLPNGAKVTVAVVPGHSIGKHPAVELMEQWAAQDSGYDAEVLTELKANLNRSRDDVGARRHFDE